MAKVAVCGGGFAAMAAAVRLVSLGHDVTVVTHETTLGAPVGSYARDRFRFDTGPTHVTLPAVLRDLFRKSGPPLEKELDLVPVEPAARYLLADGRTLDLPNASRAGALRALTEAFGPGTAGQWDALIRHGEAVWEVLRRSAQDPGRRLSRRDRRTLAPRTSLQAVLGRGLTQPAARTPLEHLAHEAGSAPHAAPAAMLARAYVEQTFGVWRVAGGLHQVVDLLGERISAKASIRTQAAPDEVRHVVDRADVVVIDRTRPTALPSTTLLAVEGRTTGPAERLVVFPGVSIWSPQDPAMRPPDGEAWTVQRAVAGGEDVLAVLSSHGYDVRDRLRWRLDVPTPPHPEPASVVDDDPRRLTIEPVPCLGDGLAYAGMSAAGVAALIGRA